MPVERELSKILAMPDDDFSGGERSSFAPVRRGQPPARPGEPGVATDGGQPAGRGDVSRMDDFQVIAERRRVMTALAALTGRSTGHSRTSLKWRPTANWRGHRHW
jgi:hypothetical protein